MPYARNARTHSPEQVAQIAASIREWGWTSPVLIDEDGTIIAGHGRVLAAQKLELAEIPAMVARGWTDAQRRAYVLADNQLALNAGWDTDLLRIELSGLEAEGFDLGKIGFSSLELTGIIGDPDDGVDLSPEEGEGDSGADVQHLSFGKHKVPLTDAELEALNRLTERYTEMNGMLYGFASWLIEARDAA